MCCIAIERPEPVVRTVSDFMQLELTRGGYEAESDAADRIEQVYKSIGRMLHCSTGEIAAVENATRGWDYIFYALPFQRGDVILTSQTEYGSNVLSFRQLATKIGVSVDVVENDPSSGVLSATNLKHSLTKWGNAVKLVAISHIPTSNGVVHPANQIGEVCRQFGVPFLLDACQSVGQLPVEVDALPCDALSATSRKYLRGPRGQGLLYVNRLGAFADLEPPFLDVWSARIDDADVESGYRVKPDARRFENYERSYANWLGMGSATDYALKWGLEAIEERIWFLAEMMRKLLRDEVSGARVTDYGERTCGIVTFVLEGIDAEVARQHLANNRINVSVSRTGSTPFDLGRRGLQSVVRASVHYYNNTDEIQVFIKTLKSMRKS